ncbi:putative Kinetochore protein fta7 [Seiridium cardinale]
MAPEAANQKRKRGRPANASRDDEGASQSQLTLTTNGAIALPLQAGGLESGEEESRPKKRGRKAKGAPEPRSEPEPEVSNREEQIQKRKRGRPSLSQGIKKVHAAGEEDPPVEQSMPRKRVRPAAPSQEAPEADGEDLSAIAQNKAPKKRGRPSLNQSKDALQDAPPVEILQPKKRGRPPRQAEAGEDTTEVAEEADDENEGNSSLLRRSGRERRNIGEWYKGSPVKTKDQPPGPEPVSEEDEEQDSSIHRGSDGDLRSIDAHESSPHSENQTRNDEAKSVAPSKARKRGRPSLKGRDNIELNQAGKTKKAKSGRSSHTTVEDQIVEGQSEIARKKKRGRPSLNQTAEMRKHRHQENGEQTSEDQETGLGSSSEKQPRQPNDQRSPDKTASKQRRRPRTSQDEPQSRSSSPEPAPYRHMTSRTRRITRHTIQDKWSPLDAASVDIVTNLLQSTSRPVLLRSNNLTKHAQATAALNAISNRLRSKISRGMPFPPATTAYKREDELEFERTVDGIQTLEAQLDPLLHGVALLQKEKERAEKELEQEYKILNSISANARSEIRGRRDQLKKVHVLVPEQNHDEDGHDLEKSDRYQAVANAAGKAFAGIEDERFKSLAGQLGDHMESMRGNLQQIDGVTPAITESRAALRMALLPHLSQEAFEQVLLD